MDYWHEIVLPVSTPESDPVREVMPACPGTVKEVMVAFPKGHRGKARCRIRYHGMQLWPSTPDAWYRGDGWIIEFPENHPMGSKPHEFIIEGYNSDADDAHTVMVRITILREAAALFPRRPVPVYEGLL
jgi:hypothetical protein